MPKTIDDLRENILSQAKEILINDGYENLNMRKVAQNVGIATGTIYNYFPTKKDLLTQLMMDYWEDYLRVFDEIDKEQEDLYAKLRLAYLELEKFIDIICDIWMRADSASSIKHTEQGEIKKKDFTERLIKRLEVIIKNYYEKNSKSSSVELSTYEISKFIILNFFMMAQMKQFAYNKFEKIIINIIN